VQKEPKKEVDEVTSDEEAPAEAVGQAAEDDPAEAGEAGDAEATNRRADMTVDGEDVEVSADAAADDGPDGESPAKAEDDQPTEADTAATAADESETPAEAEADGEITAEAEADGEITAEAAAAAEEEDSDEVPTVSEAPEPEEDDVPVTAEYVSAAAADDDQVRGGTLAADLASIRSEAASYLDDLRRLQADFDNYRKRMLREQTNRVAAASQALVSRLLPVLDNFELAISSAEQSRDFDRMLKGVEMVFGELREVLHNEGLSAIEAEGKPFDPACHEAVVAVDEDGAEAGTVLDVVRTGYEFQGKVLRPAMVKVAK
jgi:molecular chaperone GrpE